MTKKPALSLLQPRRKAGKVVEIPKHTQAKPERAKGRNSRTLEIKERASQREMVAKHEAQIDDILADVVALQLGIRHLRIAMDEVTQLYEALREQSRIKRR